MPSVLGKRKSRKAQEPAISEEEAQAIFRRHFEAQFAPLPETKKPKVAEPEAEEVLEDDAEVDSDWDGVSADEAEQAIEVVDHTDSKPHDPTAGMTKRQLKAFMVRLPPFVVPPFCLAVIKDPRRP
ncbi:Polyadenylation factor subunit 2 [Verticillium dahliae VDG2]|nr:Polyadenylation factor subunit 2 [Verticillium dahliae VDG2]